MPRGRIRAGAALTAAAALLLVPAYASAGSPNVAALQAGLKAKGLYPATVDGIPGPLTRAVHFFELDDETVWGATARILAGFLTLLVAG